MALSQRQPLDDESEPLQPVFHDMENIRTGLRPRDPLLRFTSAKPRAKV
jgi:hypothetical protein